MSVLADLSEQYRFPVSLACSDLRPDLVVHSDLTKTAIIVELTVCFETNFEAARSRKEAKYSELVEEVEDNGYDVDLVTVEVGSRGFVNYDSFRRLNEIIGASKTELHKLIGSVAVTAIKQSFGIWTSRNHLNSP